MRQRLLFLLKFFAIIVGLYYVVILRPVNDHVIVPFTEWITIASATLLRVVGEDIGVNGTMISSIHFSVNVKNACNGVEAMILLVAAIFAFPATLRSRLIGVGVGILAIQLLNVFRVSSLYWLGRHQRDLFELFHFAVWQSIIILWALSIFVFWSWRFARRTEEAAR